MEKLHFLPLCLLIFFFVVNTFAQSERTPLDDYLNNAQTIVIAKCISSGPVDILFRSDVQIEIMQVVKGDANLKTLLTKISGGLEPGEIYLIRIPDERKEKRKESFGTERSNVIPVSSSENFEILKTLSPSIVVLRTINIRLDRLESLQRRTTFEIDNLKAVKKGN